MPNFNGIKLCQDANTVCKFKDLHHVNVVAGHHEILVDEPGTVGDGGNSGFQAFNLSVQFGPLGIALVGFDLHGPHWHAPHGRGLFNPKSQQLAKWRSRLDAAAGDVAALGIEVINCSAESALTQYPKLPIQEVLRRWT